MADNVKITIKTDNSKAAKDELRNRARVALNAAGIQAASAARDELQATPKRIDTGLLRNSITHAMDGEEAAIRGYSADNASKYNGKTPDPGVYTGKAPQEEKGVAVYIGTNVNYAIYVHEGTDELEANRFIKKAVENNKEELISIIKEHLGV